MSLIARIWLALTGVITTTVAALAFLIVLQHDAVLSQLIRQRLAVTVEATARPFRSVVEIGLPVSMMRNKEELLGRARATDPAITHVLLFNPSGIIVAESGGYAPGMVPEDAITAQREDIPGRWSVETTDALITGTSILDEEGRTVGGILAIYPETDLVERSGRVVRDMVIATLVLSILFSGLAYVAVRLLLNPVVKRLERLEATYAALGTEVAGRAPRANVVVPADSAVTAIDAALDRLGGQLEAATERYRQMLLEFGAQADTAVPPQRGPRATVLAGALEGAATRDIARRLAPLVVMLTLLAAGGQGYLAFRSLDASFGPELDRRIRLIGEIATTDIQRSLEAGVPIEALAGGEEYLQNVITDFPEISYFAVVTDNPVIEVGVRQAGDGAGRFSFPVDVGTGAPGEVVAERNTGYIARQFREVLIDLGVVILVIALFSFELIVVMLTGSVTGPLDRLQHMAQLQAAGDFSRRLANSGKNVIERLGQLLSDRAERIHALSVRSRELSSGAALESPGTQPPAILKFCSLTDIRLPLFLFAMADELPLSFFALYARSLENPLAWIGDGVAIGLPFAAYMTAALLGAPIARPLGRRLGYRRLFITAALATFAAKLGLYQAENITEVVLFHGINGFAFVLAVLGCQDYALDMLPKAERSRSLGLFRATMFSGVFAAAALGGILADRLGQKTVFAVCALLSVLAALLIWRMLPAARTDREHPLDEEPPERVSFNILVPLRDPAFAAIALGSVVPLAIVDHVFITYLLALQMDALGASISEIARVMMCFFLALIAGGHTAGYLPRKLAEPDRLVLFGSTLTGVLLVALALAPSTWMSLAAAIGAGWAIGLVSGPQAVIVMALAEGRLAGLGSSATLGSVRFIERGGAVLGLFAVGWLTDRIGYSGSAGVIGIVAFSGAMIFALLRYASGSGESYGSER